VDFRGPTRSNDTPARRTGPEARLSRKSGGPAAKLSHLGPLSAANRHGQIVGVSEANGTAERPAALDVLARAERRHPSRPTTPGADKGHDAGEFLGERERRTVTPPVPAVKPPRDPKTVPRKDQIPDIRARRRVQARPGDVGYAPSPRCRKKVEEGSGWLGTVAGPAPSRRVGRWKWRRMAERAAAADNRVRMRKRVRVG